MAEQFTQDPNQEAAPPDYTSALKQFEATQVSENVAAVRSSLEQNETHEQAGERWNDEIDKQLEVIKHTMDAAKRGSDGSLPLGDRRLIENAVDQIVYARAERDAHQEVATAAQPESVAAPAVVTESHDDAREERIKAAEAALAAAANQGG